MSDREQGHQEFLGRVRASKPSVDYMVKWLKHSGYDAKAKQNTEAPTYGERMKHVDTGDIEVKMRIEVKRSRTTFGVGSLWAHEQFMICEQNQYDRADPRPMVYYILSADLKCAAGIKCSSFDQWELIERWDPKAKAKKWYYTLPRAKVRFFELYPTQ